MNLNVIGVGYIYSTGDVLFDPVLQVEDATVDLQSLVVSYVRTFPLANKTGRFDLIMPLQVARWQGLLNGTPASTERRGLADPWVRFSVNVFGSPALDPREFVEYVGSKPTRTTVGLALGVSLPLGDYQEEKLLNLGTNRFTFRPQVGVLHTHKHWSFEGTVSGFFFTDNDDFYGEGTLEQDPLWAAQGHIVYTFKPGLWLSLSAAYGWDGTSVLNGDPKDDTKNRLLTGMSLGIPLTRKQGLTIGFLRSRTLEDTGSHTLNLGVGWAIRF